MGMEQILLATVVGVAVYIIGVLLMPRSMTEESNRYTKQMLDRIYREADIGAGAEQQMSSVILKDYLAEANVFARAFFNLPGGKSAYPLLLKAGLGSKVDQFFVGVVIGFFILLAVFGKALQSEPLLIIPAAVLSTYYCTWKFLKMRVAKRNDTFINMFPDVLDMIVRSVKSGYPLNTAIQMVAENMPAPVGPEFKQVVDEVTYGRPLLDALRRLVERIDEPDIRFFVVVLSVQQEAGGNLSEVLGNLSNVIRKRKHLRLKIKALTSEGRATAWVLGSLPVLLFTLLSFVAPEHMSPLFDLEAGKRVLMYAGGLLVAGMLVVRSMIRINI